MPNAVPPTKTTLLCPKCGVDLQPKIYKKLELDVCPSCSGTWLDTLEFEYITSQKDVYSDHSIEPIFIYDPPDGSYPLHECVRCDNLMNRINFKNASGILIDVCSYHGVWLDKDEITKLRCFIASGGLDKVQDMEILKNKGRIKRIARHADDIEFIQRAIHRWNLKRLILSGWKIVG